MDKAREEIIQRLSEISGSIHNFDEVVDFIQSRGEEEQAKIINLENQLKELQVYQSQIDGIKVYIKESGIKEITDEKNSIVPYMIYLKKTVEMFQKDLEEYKQLKQEINGVVQRYSN